MDAWHLAPRDRYVTFTILGAALLAVHFLYTKYRDTMKPVRRKLRSLTVVTFRLACRNNPCTTFGSSPFAFNKVPNVCRNDVYMQAVGPQKREAQSNLVKLVRKGRDSEFKSS